MSIAADFPEADRACTRWARWLMSDNDMMGFPRVSSTGRVCDILKTGVVPDHSGAKSSIAASLVGYQDDVAERVNEIVRRIEMPLQRVLLAYYCNLVGNKRVMGVTQQAKMLSIGTTTFYRRLRIAVQRVQNDITSRDGYIVA